MPIYMKFDAIGSTIGSGGATQVHGMSLGARKLTPGSITHGVHSSNAGGGWSHGSEIHAFDFGVQSPRDPQSGSASGKRQHGSFTITKSVDKASPLIFQSCVNNESFKSLNVHLYTSPNPPKKRPSLTIQLSDVRLVGVSSAKHQAATDTYELEEILFSYEKIEISHDDGKVTKQDDWTQ